ncbi:uncharacterized protein [Palaemon carinicauda]|uniref:uncharacterized protein n=1 Tax=Palaemon carinicauda TaxID=392227 RepID=UPI0035B5CFF3
MSILSCHSEIETRVEKMWCRFLHCWPSLPIIILCTSLLAALAYGDERASRRQFYEGEDKSTALQTVGGAPDATYESLRDILSNEYIDDRQRSETNVSGFAGIVSQKVVSGKAVSSKAAEPLTIDFQQLSNYVLLSPQIVESLSFGSRSTMDATTVPLGTEMAAQAKETSREGVTSPTVVTTTARNYYCASPSIPSNIMILPAEEQFWEVGSPHSMSCLIDPASGFTSSDIYLSLGFRGDPIPHQIVDNYTITATVDIAEPGEYKLFCSSEFLPPKVCTRSIIVGYPPLDVSDLECRSWNWKILECSWKIPHNPAQEPADDYQIHLVSSNEVSECHCDGGAGRCGSRTEGCMKTCCSWDQPSYPPAEQYLTINVTAVNQLGSESFAHRIDNWNVVIPDEAENVVVTTTDGSLEVGVIWDMPVYISTLAAYYGVHYAVEYRPNPTTYGETSWRLGALDVCKSSKCDTSIRVEHPGATYEIRVRLRVNRTNFTLEDDGWWSKWTPVRCDVPAQRPWTPPSTGAGTFQVRNGNGRRDVSVSWRPLSLLQQNGPNFTYIIDASIDGKSLAYSEATDTFVTYRNISDNSYLSVNVTSVNSAGVSNASASVGVLPAMLMPAAPVLQVVVYHATAQQYEVTWHELGDSKNNYAVYVCTDKSDSKDPCKGNLYWVDVGNATSVNVTLSDFGLDQRDNKDLRFAVSGETHDTKISSGMSWDGCYHPQTYRRTTMPPMLSSSIPVTPTSANVSWTLDCENRAGIVESVFAEWCPANHNFSTCNGTKTANHTDIVSGLVVLRDLEPDTEYMVRLRIQYREGLSGWSIYRTLKTSRTVRPVMATWLIATIASICIIVAVFFFFCFSYSRMKVKEISADIGKHINVPAGITRDIILKSPDQKTSQVETSTTVAVDASSVTRADERKHPEEAETLIKWSGAPEFDLIPSPQHSRRIPASQGSSGYVEADFSPKTSSGYVSIAGGDPASPSPVRPRRFVGESDVPSGNGYVMYDDVGIGVAGIPRGILKDGEKTQIMELSDFRFPSSGYVSVLHHPGLANLDGDGYVESDFSHEISASAENAPRVAKNDVPREVGTMDWASTSFSGKGRGYVQLDSTHANILPPELLQQFSHDSGLGEEQQAQSNSDESLTVAADAPRKESPGKGTLLDGFEESKQPRTETLFKKNINGYVEHSLSHEDVEGGCFKKNQKGYAQQPVFQEDVEGGCFKKNQNGYVQHPVFQEDVEGGCFKKNQNGYVQHPVFQEDVEGGCFKKNQNGYVQHPVFQDVEKDCFSKNQNGYVQHPVFQDVEGDSFKRNHNGYVQHPVFRDVEGDSFKRNQNGYVHHPLSQEDFEGGCFEKTQNGYVQHPVFQKNIEGYGKEVPRSVASPFIANTYVDSQDCFPSDLILQVDSTDTGRAKAEALKSDTGTINKDSLEFSPAGYVKTEISYENGITIKANKDDTGGISAVMESALSYVMMPELTLDVLDKNSRNGEAHTSGEVSCKSIDLGEGTNLLNGYTDAFKGKDKLRLCSEIEENQTGLGHVGMSTEDPPVGYCRIGDGGW